MAARCAVCGKGPQTGFTVSHSHRRTKRSFRPNLQSVRTTPARVRQVPQGWQGSARGRVNRVLTWSKTRLSFGLAGFVVSAA